MANGQQINVGHGQLSPSSSSSISGHVLGVQQGALTVSAAGASSAISGQHSPVLVGSFSSGIVVNLRSRKSPYVSSSANLTGLSIQSSVGSINASVSQQLVGSSIVASVGALSLGISRSLSGIQIQSQNGSITVGSQNAAPQWGSSSGATFNLSQGQSLDLRGTPYFTDANSDVMTMTLQSGSLTSGLTFSNGIFTASASATTGTAGPFVVRADDGVSGTTDITTLSVTSTLAGTNSLPWSAGQAFKQGDIPAGSYITTDNATSQAKVRNTWPDGSVKFAVISGVSSLTANTPKSIKLQRTDTAPSGANVTEPTTLDASVTFSGDVTGTYTVQSCLGIDRSTWALGSAGRVRQILGPVMSEFHYYRPTTDAHVAVWFYVRRYSTGETEVETVVENGWLNVASPGQKDYTVTVSVGGSTRYGPTALSHLHHTRWSRSDWIGTDPQVTPSHNVAYVKSTKLVPNYVSGTPQAAYFTDSTATNPAPFDQGSYPTSMGGAGWTPSIGIFPMWSARYYTNGDVRAYQSTVGHMRRYGRYGTHYRDETTGLPVLATTTTNILSTNSGISYVGNQTPSTPLPSGLAPPSWASSHHPIAGYDAYLLTGSRVAADEMDFLAALPQLSINDVDQFSSARRFGWCMRTIAASAAISPESSIRTASASSLATYCNYQYDYWVTGQPSNNLGAIELIANEQYTGDGLYRDYAPWMVGYAVTSLSWASEIGVGLTGTDLTKFIGLRGRGPKLYVGLAGDSSGYPYPQMSNAYSIPWGDGQTNDAPTTWFTFAQAYSNMVSRAQADAGATGTLGQNFGAPGAAVSADGLIQYSELHGIAAVAYAVDHGISGASASWSRITSAPNYISNAQRYVDEPLFAIRPRTV